MQKDRSFWPEWAHILQQWGLTELVAALLEAAGPLNVLFAQLVFAGQPILGQVIPGERLAALASLFDNQEEAQSFAAYLREESSG